MSVQFTKLTNLRFIQYRAPNLFAACCTLGVLALAILIATFQAFGVDARTVAVAGCLAPLAVAVGVVFGARAKPKVIWIAALAIVAGVANQQPLGDRAFGQLIRQTMGPYVLALIPESAVATIVAGTLPVPAFAWLAAIYFRPEVGGCILRLHRLISYPDRWVPRLGLLAAAPGL